MIFPLLCVDPLSEGRKNFVKHKLAITVLCVNCW